ncbi:MAG: Gfo/Idh/MocA family oxidoreductase [Pseudomonadota bacterium]
MTAPLSYGLIGAGMMGQEHLRTLALHPHAQITVILEPDAGMRKAAHALAPGVIFVNDLDALLNNPLDAIIIATPNDLHANQLCDILNRRVIPVILEKPCAINLAQVVRLRALPKDAPVWVGMEYRYMPPLQAFIQFLQDQQAGKLVNLTMCEHRFGFLSKVGNWNRFNARTGGTMVEKCCHFFDLMSHIIGDTPVRLYASGGQDVNHRDERYEGRIPDILDNAYVLVDFACGVRACLHLCMFAEGAPYQEEITAIGEHAKIVCRIPGPARLWRDDNPQPPADLCVYPRTGKVNPAQTFELEHALHESGDHYGSTFYHHEKIYAWLTGAGPIEVGLPEGLRAVVMGLAAQESMRAGTAMSLRDGDFALA